MFFRDIGANTKKKHEKLKELEWFSLESRKGCVDARGMLSFILSLTELFGSLNVLTPTEIKNLSLSPCVDKARCFKGFSCLTFTPNSEVEMMVGPTLEMRK